MVNENLLNIFLPTNRISSKRRSLFPNFFRFQIIGLFTSPTFFHNSYFAVLNDDENSKSLIFVECVLPHPQLTQVFEALESLAFKKFRFSSCDITTFYLLIRTVLYFLEKQLIPSVTSTYWNKCLFLFENSLRQLHLWQIRNTNTEFPHMHLLKDNIKALTSHLVIYSSSD